MDHALGSSRLSRVAGLAWAGVRAWRGLIAVIVLFVGFGALNVLGIPPLLPIDERAHLGYALSIADGDLPTIDTPLSPTLFPPDARDHRNDIWVANHPPLYYAIVAPAASHGLTTGGIEHAVWSARWISLLLGAATLVFVHAAAMLVTRGNRDIALLTTFTAASIPHTIHVCALVYNDSLAILLSATTLYTSLLLAERGYSHTRAGALAVSVALAGLTRFTSVAVVIPALGIACLGIAYPSEVPTRRRVVQSISTAGIVVASVLVTSAWFYLGNLRRYGDVTGGAALFEKVGRSERDSALEHALQPKLWRQIYHDLWSRFGGGIRIDGIIPDLAWLVLFVALVGVCLRVRALLLQRPARWFTKSTLGVAGLAAALALMLAAMFEFYSRGGSLHARYVLPVLWVFTLFLAWGLDALGAGIVRTVIVLLCIIDLLVFGAYLGSLGADASGDDVVFVRALERGDVGGATWIVGTILVAIALSLHTILGEYGKPPQAAASSIDI